MIEWKQREIKFRRLLKEYNWNNGTYYPPQWLVFDCPHPVKEMGLVFSQHMYPELDEWLSPYVQYTGLKDKNGKEIYEGDIARDISGKVAVIVYSPPSFFAQFKGELWDINTKGSPVEMVECIEVIGNIFENPELLEDKP